MFQSGLLAKTKRLLRLIVLRPRSNWVMINYSAARWCYERGLQKVSAFLHCRSLRCYDVEICIGARLASSVRFPHPTGIVIGGGAVVGEGVVIHQNVTLGASYFDPDSLRGQECSQVIGKNTVLGAGAKILGEVKIGERCLIGANAVITKDIPDFSTVVSNNKIISDRTSALETSE